MSIPVKIQSPKVQQQSKLSLVTMEVHRYQNMYYRIIIVYTPVNLSKITAWCLNSYPVQVIQCLDSNANTWVQGCWNRIILQVVISILLWIILPCK